MNMQKGILSILVLVGLCGCLVASDRGKAEESTGSESVKTRLGIQFGHRSSGWTSAAFSPDGRLVLTAALDNTILWNVDTGRELRRFTGHTEFVTSASFSPDGRFVLTAEQDNTVRLWDAATGRVIRDFVGHAATVTSAAFSPNGRWVLTASQDGETRLWDVATGQELRRLADDFKWGNSAAFSPDGQRILTTGKGVRVWDTETGQELRRFEGNFRWASSAAFSPDGSSVLTVSKDNVVCLWDVTTGRELSRFVGHTESVASASFSPDGRFVLSTGLDNAILWDVAAGREVHPLTGHAGHVNSAVFSPDGHRVLTAGQDDTVRLWDVSTGREQRRFAGLAQFMTTASFSPHNGRFVLTAGEGGVFLWDTVTGRELRRFARSGAFVTSATYSPDQRFILTAGQGDDEDPSRQRNAAAVSLWDAVTGREVRRFGDTRYAPSAVFSPDGAHVLTASWDDQGAVLWDTETGKRRRYFVGHTGAVNSAVFSPDGRWVLTASEDQTARLWDTATGKERRRFDNHSGVKVAIFSPDGKVILTGGNDMSLKDTETGEERLRFGSEAGAVRSAAFSPPDGHFVMTVNVDGTTRFWIVQPSNPEVQPGKEVARLVSLSDRQFAVTTPEGRFDIKDLEEVKGLHWIMSDDPWRALPLEMFMREYYEPRLLPRAIAWAKAPPSPLYKGVHNPKLLPRALASELARASTGEQFLPLPSLIELNRAQPRVAISDISVDAHDGLATVTVEVASDTVEIVDGGVSRVMKSGAYDLRLFRDGQLVAQYPEPQPAASYSEQNREQELDHWRQRHQITIDPLTRKEIVNFREIRLPHKAGLKRVEFSSYAFNGDRVKSETARRTLLLPKDFIPRQGRAYIVTIGVNGFEHDAMPRLSFAVNDARIISTELIQQLRKIVDPQTGRLAFGEPHVVPITLISDFGAGDQAETLVINEATKGRIKAVIDRLAGKPVDPALLRGIVNAEQLQLARPEDLVLISISTHGDTDRRGQFYLMPSDLRARTEQTDIRQDAISSEELSTWLRPVDAGELVMIVDACHSAATVEGGGFKPGPMGARGLGQLAYDKGMRILAASQRDQKAKETQSTRQGLLTYALVHDGLQNKQADLDPKDNKIHLVEWLQYGARHVPNLYKRNGKFTELVVIPPDRSEEENYVSIQEPALFDFKRGGDLLLMKLGQ